MQRDATNTEALTNGDSYCQLWPPALPSRKKIQFVGTATAYGDTIGIPAHQAGDLIVIISDTSSTLTVPTLAPGFSSVLTYSLEVYNAARRVQVLRDGANSVSSVTCTGATSILALVYRNASGIGATAQSSGGPGTNLTIPALTLQDPTNFSWVIGYAATNQATTLATVATGLTLRAQKSVGAGGTSWTVFDTAAPVTAFAGSVYDWSGLPSAYYTPLALEILAG